jgi:SAM-dependent methyltransferase
MTMPKLTSHTRDWEDLAHVDPFFAILTTKGKEFGKWDQDEFFSTGQAVIDPLMESCGLSLGDNGRALDFGCGAGRLSRTLRRYFGEVYGVDISEEMVRLAKRLTPSCNFVVNRSDDLKVFSDDYFDFIYSNIVLQHQPTKEMARAYIREFIRVVKPTGTIVFQIPYRLTLRTAVQPKRRLYAILRAFGFSADFIYKHLRLNPMRGICLSSADVTATVSAQAGARVVRFYPDAFNQHSMSYVVTKG